MRFISVSILVVLLSACSTTRQTTLPNSAGLTVNETTKGLVEALLVGADHSAEEASKKDGFFKNAAIKILFPPEVQQVREAAIRIGLTPVVNRFEMSMNRAAEDAAKEAKPILVGAIKRIKFKDVWGILFGGKTAATDYLRAKTETQLLSKFRPIVRQSIGREEVTKHWQPLATAYNSIPFVKKVNPNLEQYVTQRTLEGLFTLIAEEERKIRENPIARVSQILKKVFGANRS